MKKSQLRKLIRESIKGLMTEQPGTTCHYFSACGVAGVPGYSYPYYLDYYNAPNQADKTIKSNDFYVAVGSPSAGSVVRVTGMNNPVWQGGQYISHPLDYCLTYNGTYACTTGMSSYLLTASGTPMSDCNSCERWDCKPKGSHPKFGSKCVPAGPGGQFTTQQDCIASGCEGFSDDQKDTKTQTPFNPLTTTPQAKVGGGPGCTTNSDCGTGECCYSLGSTTPGGYCDTCDERTGPSSDKIAEPDDEIQRMQKLANIEPDQPIGDKPSFPVDRDCVPDPDYVGNQNVDCGGSTCNGKGGCPAGCKCP